MNKKNTSEVESRKDFGNAFIDPNLFDENMEKYRAMLYEALKPVPKISITDWAENELVLPPSVTSEPGKFRMTRTPYMREIVDCLHPDSPINEIFVWFGTQLGKTQSIFNSIAFNVSNAPAGILFGFSNETEMKKMIQNRFEPIFDANPNLKKRIFSNKSGRSGDTLNQKMFAGGDITFVSGETVSGWISNPRRYVYIDELDQMPKNLGGRGNVISLARDRVASFGDRYKLYASSTCTDNDSAIVREYNLTDMRKPFIKCPFCGHSQLLDFAKFKWVNEDLLVTDVYMECEECKKHIHDYDKVNFLKTVEWKPTNPLKTPSNKRGYWMSALYSPWLSWNSIVEEYLKASKDNDINALKAFYNSTLAQVFEEQSDVPDWQRIYNEAKGSPYCSGMIPNEVIFLTSATDVQDNRLETEIVGWGRNGRCYSIQYYKFFCEQNVNTEDINSKCWSELREQVLDMKFIREDGVVLRTVQNAIDRSYHTTTVNAFWADYCRLEEARGEKDYRLTEVRGRDNINDIITAFKQDRPGQKGRKNVSKNKQRKEGIFLFIDVGVSVLKHQFYKDLNTEDNTERTKANIHIYPADYDEEYYKMLTAERYYPPDHNHKNGHWGKLRDRNEALDLNGVYNRAMWHLVGGYTLTDKDYDNIQARYSQSIKATKVENQKRTQAKRRILNKGIQL